MTKASSSPSPAGTSGAGVAPATGEPLKIGQMCDRSGPTVNVGTKLCDGFQDWIGAVNAKLGGVKGRPVQAIELDHKFEIALAVDTYKRLVTRDQVPEILSYGTPTTEPLVASAVEDRVLLWTPAFGLSAYEDGRKFPYLFIGVASYQAQAMAILDYLAAEWKAQGKTGNPKVIYLYYDNPAGRDPLDVIKNEAPGLGVDLLDLVGVPGTTLDMMTILGRIKEQEPDYIVANLFGRAPSFMLQAAEKVSFPRERIFSLVWGISEDEITVAQQAAEMYRGLQFSALMSDDPEAYQLLDQYWQDSGQPPNPKRNSVHYARGVLSADLMVQALLLADDPRQGESVKEGAERIRDFTAHGMLGGTTLTADDHGGTRKVRMYEVQNGELKRIKDWFEGPRPQATPDS